MLMTFGQGQEMNLTFDTHNTSLAQHVVCIYQSSGHRATKLPEKFNVFPFSLKSLCIQNLLCRKIGQGQPKVMIYINYDGQESPMLYTKVR